jgi:hypothetical protein
MWELRGGRMEKETVEGKRAEVRGEEGVGGKPNCSTQRWWWWRRGGGRAASHHQKLKCKTIDKWVFWHKLDLEVTGSKPLPST